MSPFLLLAALAAPASRAGDWIQADPGYAWSFPRDHFSHPGYRIEWWYFTGHLESGGRSFGFQFTLFRVGLAPEPPPWDSAWSAADLLLGHASLTDKERGEHRFAEVLYRAIPLLAGFGAPPGPLIAWSRAPAGSAGSWSLAWLEGPEGPGFELQMEDVSRGFALALQARPLKPLVLQAPNGYSRKAAAPGAASLYYSFTRLSTAGELRLEGEVLPVQGESWMDREFSTSHLGQQQVGWDWFALQLEDGREIMLYRLRREDGATDFACGTAISARGAPRYLAQEDWTAEPTGRWTSPATRAVYPSGWRLELPSEGLRLRIEPAVAGQENVSRLAAGLAYWEGAVDVRDASGSLVGRGYVELTGYAGGKSRPPL